METATATKAQALETGRPRRIDLNADVGEGLDDEPLLELVSSVNIACGGHAGDDKSMAHALDHAATFGVAAGAHPSYFDRENFGRAELSLPTSIVGQQVAEQVAELLRIAERLEVPLCHVKPHGALYNQAAIDMDLALAVANAVKGVDPMLRLVGLAGSLLTAAGASIRLGVGAEGFADRRYRTDGTLAPRSFPDALITDRGEAAAQAVAIALGEPMVTVDGEPVAVEAQTICVHGDTPGAVDIARAVREALIAAGFEILPL
jgi:UPF0271 protein